MLGWVLFAGVGLCLLSLLQGAAWRLVRHVLVPLGAMRLAAFFARLAWWRLKKDRRGGALMAAAWASLRRRPPKLAEAPDSAGSIAWLEAALGREPSLRGCGVVAHGLLLARRGDNERARQTLHSVFDMDPALVPRDAEALAAQYLVADAAARGAWAEVRRLGWAPRRPRYAATRFVGAAAHRIVEEPRPTKTEMKTKTQTQTTGQPPGELTMRWWFFRAGSPAALRPLFTRALVARRAAFPPAPRTSDLAPPLPEAALPRALALHTRTLNRPALFLAIGDLDALGHAFDTALADAETQRLVLRRAVGLCADAEESLVDLRETAVKNLAELARSGRVPVDEAALSTAPHKSPILLAAARRLRENLLDELEAGCADLRRRVETNRGLPLLDEWREWSLLRGRYELAVRLCGESLRRLIWPTYHRAVCAHGVWMFNDRDERIFGNTVARHLLVEAEAIGDEVRAELQRKNVDCGS